MPIRMSPGFLNVNNSFIGRQLVPKEYPFLESLVLVLVFSAALWIYQDYKIWLSRGKGGVPQNLFSYCNINLIRIRLWLASFDPCDFKVFERLVARGDGGKSYLNEGEIGRRGPGPRCWPHPIPHRHQITVCDRKIGLAQRMIFTSLINQHPDTFFLSRSHLECRSPALYINSCYNIVPCPLHKAKTQRERDLRLNRGEFCHLHETPRSSLLTSTLSSPATGFDSTPPQPSTTTTADQLPFPDPSLFPTMEPDSIHLVLSPSDALKAVKQGWAERHPLTGFGRLRFRIPDWFGVCWEFRDYCEFPPGSVLVYAPRDWKELKVVELLIKAGASYLSDRVIV